MNSGDQNYKEACGHYEKGKLDEAIKLFSKAIDYYSKSMESNKEAKAHYYRGCAFYRLGIQCERNQMFEESEENFDKALEDFEKVSEKIKVPVNHSEDKETKDGKSNSDYYRGCTCYKLGVLYAKKRASCKSHRAFINALAYLENASQSDLYKDNGKLWFYKGLSSYNINNKNNSLADFEKAATYDYYNIEIFGKLLDSLQSKENESKEILLLYYLKRYENINNISDNYLNLDFDFLKDLINKYGREGAYYCALSRYEVKDFKNSLKIFDKLAKEEVNNDLSSKKISSISWYYRGLLLQEFTNNCDDGSFLGNILLGHDNIGDGEKRIQYSNNEKRDFQYLVNNKKKEILNKYKLWNNKEDKEKKAKFVKYLIDNLSTDHSAKEVFQEVVDIESQTAFEKALEEYNKIIDSPQTFGLYYEKALVLDELKRYKEAIESLDEFLKNKPRNAKAWLKKGTILFKIAKDEEIKTTSEEPKIENKNEKSPCEKEITRIEAAKDALKKSIWYFKILIDENPKNPDHWYNRGTAHSSLAEVFIKTRDYQDALKEYEEAIKAFDNATTLNPKFALAWNNKGNVYIKLKKYNKAIEAFEEAFEINPNYYLALHNKGDALYSLGKYEEAIDVYKEVITKDEKQSGTTLHKSWNDRGLALYKLEIYDEAIEAFKKALYINPSFAEGWINKGLVFYKLEILSEAKKTFEKALKLEPGNARASNNLGVVLARDGELDRAKKLFENTIQENPDAILVQANLAELLLNSGGIEEASRKIESIPKDDKNPDSNMVIFISWMAE